MASGYHVSVLDSLRQRGWTAVREITRTGFLELAYNLGTPWFRPAGVVEQLRVREREDAPSRSLSGIHGRGAFPLHTDLAHYAIPPRYVLLRNASTLPIRPTTVQPLHALSCSQAASRTLQRRVWVIRGGPAPFYAPVLFGAGAFVRWDSACMSPGPLATDALHAWTDYLALAKPCNFDWDVNTVLVIDNWRALHGRVAGTMESDSERILERIVVS